jgi:DNA-binding NtrC family response regulator
VGNKTTVVSDDAESEGEVELLRTITLVYPEAEEPKRWWLERGRVVLGREPPSGGIAIEDDEVSRQHGALQRVPASNVYRIEDLGSRNGVFLDGRKIESDYLAPGSVIRIGGTLLVYEEVAAIPGEDLELRAGGSLALARAERFADLAAPTRTPVLILGPTGAGKERLAARVHAASRRSGQCVVVNCATLNRELLGSELFGHVKGAFSGAESSRNGLFLEASGGTLFLDEIAELPLDQQPALLRVLQEGRVRPVGSDRETPVDVRIVAATHQDLRSLDRDGRFRSDLYARLAGLTIELPGLAERRSEILPLFRGFFGPGSPPLSLKAAEVLLAYEWPRNIRELMHLAGQLALFGRLEKIERSALPKEMMESAPEGERGAPSRERIEQLLAEHGGNVAEVARALGTHRQQVYRWLRQFKLDAKSFRA